MGNKLENPPTPSGDQQEHLPPEALRDLKGPLKDIMSRITLRHLEDNKPEVTATITKPGSKPESKEAKKSPRNPTGNIVTFAMMSDPDRGKEDKQ